MYIDPRNPRHAIQEAQHLITLSDTNLDGKLDLTEILSKMDLFLGSKMVDTERSFHDEFWYSPYEDKYTTARMEDWRKMRRIITIANWFLDGRMDNSFFVTSIRCD